METWIPASSPLFALSPCKTCTNGWASVPALMSNRTLDSGFAWTTNSSSSIALNFTGTGVSFDVSQPNTSIWTTELLINGTSFHSSTLEDKSLPWGTHSVELRLPGMSNTSDLAGSTSDVVFHGATISLGTLSGATSINTTIDDTEWRTSKVVLSPGWNMMGKGESNWINSTQMEEETVNAANYWNKSLSWTEQLGANTAISFSGSAVWVYGVTGGQAGSFSVMLDDTMVGSYNASSGSVIYNSSMYTTSGLVDTNHTLTLINQEQGKRLSFDRLVYMSGLMSVTNHGSPAPLPAPSESSKPDESLSQGAIAGIVVGSVVGLLALLLSAWTVWAMFARHKATVIEDAKSATTSFRNHHKSFWRWSGTIGHTGHSRRLDPSDLDAPFRPFVPLREKNSIPNLGTAVQRLATPSSPPTSSGLPTFSQSYGASTLGNSLGVSFLKLSKSPRKPPHPLKDDLPIPDLPTFDRYHEANGEYHQSGALNAALSDTISPLSTLKESYLPKLGLSKLGKKHTGNRSISIKTAKDVEDGRPPTPGGILDGYFTSRSGMARHEDGKEGEHGAGGEWNRESTLPSMGERNPKKFLGKVFGDGRPSSGESAPSAYSS